MGGRRKLALLSAESSCSLHLSPASWELATSIADWWVLRSIDGWHKGGGPAEARRRRPASRGACPAREAVRVRRMRRVGTGARCRRLVSCGASPPREAARGGGGFSRRQPASGGASPAREAARVWSRTRRRRVGLGRHDSGRWLFRWAGPYPSGRIRIRSRTQYSRN